jgi:hypothetical protein
VRADGNALRLSRQISQRLRDVLRMLFLLPWHFLALLARLGKRDGDRLLATFHLAAPSTLAAFRFPRL